VTITVRVNDTVRTHAHNQNIKTTTFSQQQTRFCQNSKNKLNKK